MDEDRATSEKADESILIAEKQEVLFAELVRQLYSNAPIGMLATAINSLALVAIERNIISKGSIDRLAYLVGPDKRAPVH